MSVPFQIERTPVKRRAVVIERAPRAAEPHAPTEDAVAVSVGAAEAVPADPKARQRRDVVGALLASLGAITTLVAFAVIWALPQHAPAAGLAIVVVGTIVAWGAARTERRNLAGEVERLTAENADLATRLEGRSDAEWKLRESEERDRSLIDELVQARRKAEAASEAKSRVLATVSHEFRTPLNGILGLTGLLAETPLSPDQETYTRAVHSSGEALLALVDDMLDFSKIEAGRLDLNPEPTNVEGLLQDIAELLASRAHLKGIDIAVDVAADTPALVTVDRARLRQVLINLAGNAVKFTDRGGVTLSAVRAGDGVRFTVRDTGPGIAPDDVERLFGEFEQRDSALSRRHGGAGLGLAISRRIVRRMGGDIVVTSDAGGGATFAFTLALPVVARDVGPPATADRLMGQSILVLAPDGAEAPVIRRELADAGATVRIAPRVRDAAALAGAAAAAGEPHDLVLIDERVAPGAEQALVLIREAAGAPVPAVVLIEPGDRGRVDRLKAAGFNAYLVRPVRRWSLLRIANDVIAGGGFQIDPSDARPPKTQAEAKAPSSLEVLLAEDNEINALLARAVLERLGHTVTEVRDGQAAVDAVKASPGRFSVVLMDLHMPGLDGLGAVRAIRELERDEGRRTAILAVTADVLAETRAAAEEAGVDAMLEKPMTPNALRAALARLVDQAAA